MNRLLLCNCCGDDRYAKLSKYLLENHFDKVLEGIKQKAAEIEAEEVAVLLPIGSTYHFPIEFSVYYGEESPVTINSFAAAEVIKGKMARPFISEESAVFNKKEVHMIKPEDAYKLVKESVIEGKIKLMSLNYGKQSDILEILIDSNLSEVIMSSNRSMDKVKGVLLGGLQGKFINITELSNYDVKEDSFYDSLTFFDEDACMVEELKQITSQIQSASCGKCVLCREGSLQDMTIMEEMTLGKAKMPDLELLKEIGELIKIGAYCTFGQSFPNVIKTAFELFVDEFEAHIKKKNCPVNVCAAFGSYIILPKQCTGCEECLDSCPEEAIEGKKGFIHMIKEDLCEKCGKCVEACEVGAIIRIGGTKPKLPTKLTKVGKF